MPSDTPDWAKPIEKGIINPGGPAAKRPAPEPKALNTAHSASSADKTSDQIPDWAMPVSKGIVRPLGHTTELPATARSDIPSTTASSIVSSSDTPSHTLLILTPKAIVTLKPKTPPVSPGPPPNTPSKMVSVQTIKLAAKASSPPANSGSPQRTVSIPAPEGTVTLKPKTPPTSPGPPPNTPSKMANFYSSEPAAKTSSSPTTSTSPKRKVSIPTPKGTITLKPKTPPTSPGPPPNTPSAQLGKEGTPPPPPNPPPNTPSSSRTILFSDDVEVIPRHSVIACGPTLNNAQPNFLRRTFTGPSTRLPTRLPSMDIILQLADGIQVPVHITRKRRDANALKEGPQIKEREPVKRPDSPPFPGGLPEPHFPPPPYFSDTLSKHTPESNKVVQPVSRSDTPPTPEPYFPPPTLWSKTLSTGFAQGQERKPALRPDSPPFPGGLPEPHFPPPPYFSDTLSKHAPNSQVAQPVSRSDTRPTPEPYFPPPFIWSRGFENGHQATMGLRGGAWPYDDDEEGGPSRSNISTPMGANKPRSELAEEVNSLAEKYIWDEDFIAGVLPDMESPWAYGQRIIPCVNLGDGILVPVASTSHEDDDAQSVKSDGQPQGIRSISELTPDQLSRWVNDPKIMGHRTDNEGKSIETLAFLVIRDVRLRSFSSLAHE